MAPTSSRRRSAGGFNDGSFGDAHSDIPAAGDVKQRCSVTTITNVTDVTVVMIVTVGVHCQAGERVGPGHHATSPSSAVL